MRGEDDKTGHFSISVTHSFGELASAPTKDFDDDEPYVEEKTRTVLNYVASPKKPKELTEAQIEAINTFLYKRRP